VLEGRIIAAGHAPAEAVLTDAGWSDRPLEIFVPAASPKRRAPKTKEKGSAGGGLNLAELKDKPVLTGPEAIAFLRSLDSL
jgi:hypothetical protein